MNKHIIQTTVLSRKKVDKLWIGGRVKSLFRRRDKLFARQKSSGKPADKKLNSDAKAKAQCKQGLDNLNQII